MITFSGGIAYETYLSKGSGEHPDEITAAPPIAEIALSNSLRLKAPFSFFELELI